MLYELPRTPTAVGSDDEESAIRASANERSPLLRQASGHSSQGHGTEESLATNGDLSGVGDASQENDEFAASFESLNALEIAAVSGAKKFLSQHIVQRMVSNCRLQKVSEALVYRF